MAEYMGDAHSVDLQKSIRARNDQISANPLLANGGRVMNILDPEAYGWDNVCRDAKQDGFVGLTMVPRDETLARLASMYGDEMDFPYWETFTGLPEEVLEACEKLVSKFTLPEGWTVSSYTHPDDETIHASQVLNQENGVAPTPAYYLGGDDIPSLLTCAYDDNGELAACASASMRYHSDSPLSNWLFAGGVSVSTNHRRRGLGSYVNARLLLESHAEFGWSSVLEQAKADNPASIGMITRCGLQQNPGLATIVINTTGGYITR